MRKRLDAVDETRRRIVEAAVELHGSVGPAETTVSAIAERAGVQRSTIYRHFPDEESLFGACTSHWLSGHPWPDHEQWSLLADPAERLAHGLDELYRFYAAGREMIANSYRDMAAMPEFVGVAMATQVKAMHSALVSGWKGRGRQRRLLEAAIAHAIDFRSWQSLSDAGLSPTEGAKLMTRMVLASCWPVRR
jgi:AcrR family transcriptional regulator